MRTSKKQIKENAKHWYSLLMNGVNGKSAIMINRKYSKTNPHIVKTTLTYFNSNHEAIVIAESLEGFSGCLEDLIQNITEDIYITYNDGTIIVFKRKKG